MKNTGMTRPVDDLGRVVIPQEIRKSLNISAKDRLYISMDGEKIILQKNIKACAICGSSACLYDIDGHTVCHSCIKRIKEI